MNAVWDGLKLGHAVENSKNPRGQRRVLLSNWRSNFVSFSFLWERLPRHQDAGNCDVARQVGRQAGRTHLEKFRRSKVLKSTRVDL